MNVEEFQKKLTELCALAGGSENQLDVPTIRNFFEGMDLEQSQLLKVVQYLKSKGITITGMETTQEEGSEAEENIVREAVPLSPQEQAYYQEYQAGFASLKLTEKSLELLFQELRNGSEEAGSELISRYLPVAGELAVSMNCEEIPLPDLIQEANMSLMTALREAEPALKSDPWIRLQLRKGIAHAIEEQTQQKYADEQLVEKVQKLEDAIRDLTEDEEGGESPFSVNELAIILDMEIDEIKDILRLTGDEN
jgi:RNA polymerase primary sigma factor